MTTTLELPDELMREVKIRAVHEHKKLKDTVAELIRKGIAADKSRTAKLPKPVKLRRGFIPTTEDIEAAIAWGIEQDWLRHDTAYVELRAAGIHVAKEMLGLAREVAD